VRRRSVLARALAVVAVGLAVGAATSFGQRYLDSPFSATVNSASVWLVAPFVVGSWMRSTGGAAAAGLTVCLLQLVGYQVTADLCGYSTSTALFLFWAACGVVGGPVFGVAGHRSREGRALGASVVSAAFLAEGVWVYAHELHSYGQAALWIGIGAAIAAAIVVRRPAEAPWLAAAFPVALACEIAVTQVYVNVV
jgi:Family of unknown function (DUF6518)